MGTVSISLILVPIRHRHIPCAGPGSVHWPQAIPWASKRTRLRASASVFSPWVRRARGLKRTQRTPDQSSCQGGYPGFAAGRGGASRRPPGPGRGPVGLGPTEAPLPASLGGCRLRRSPTGEPGCRRPRTGSRPSSGTRSRARASRFCTGSGSSPAAPAECDRDYPLQHTAQRCTKSGLERFPLGWRFGCRHVQNGFPLIRCLSRLHDPLKHVVRYAGCDP